MSTVKFRITLTVPGRGLQTAVFERITGAIMKKGDGAFRLGDEILVDTDSPGQFVKDFFDDGFDFSLTVDMLP